MIDSNNLEKFLNDMAVISKVSKIESRNDCHIFDIDICLPELEVPLIFSVILDPWYPAKSMGSESIHFINKDLIEYSHIMEGGNLCVHTISCTDWKEKLESDIMQLCQWIKEYYIEKKKDEHFEHLVVNESEINSCYYSYNYAQVSTKFSNHECGIINYLPLINGTKNGKTIMNYIIASYHSKTYTTKQPTHISPFSDNYIKSNKYYTAPYIIIDTIPGKYNKFVYTNFADFHTLVTKDQLDFIYTYTQEAKSVTDSIFPLFIGYPIPNDKMAWNVAMLNLRDLPLEGIPERNNGNKTGIWKTIFKNMPIQWGITNDISPEYFFGRGSFPSIITPKKILILGIGAIGSMLATTLVRGGCNNIVLYDFDIKHPGNICRSEYTFLCPTDEKMRELTAELQRISPYVNISFYKEEFDQFVKYAVQQNQSSLKEELKRNFEQSYDLIFDCTTDDDVMYALEQLSLSIDVVNLSISNHANELVCAFSPSIYEFVKGIYAHAINQDSKDVFFPTGCWNPTFKATYNDIASKLQFAIKKIILMLSGEENKQNFVIFEDKTGLHFQPW